MRQQIFSLLVDNTTGVLSRVSGLFSRRGYNIDSITAGVTADSRYTRMTVCVTGDELILEQIENQLRKLQDVRHIKKLADTDSVCRELMIVKLKATKADLPNIMSIAEVFHGKIVDAEDQSFMISLVGNQAKLESFLSILSDYEILELARSGLIGLSRGIEDVEFLD